MKTAFTNATLQFYPQGSAKFRIFALWYFLTLLIIWNILGHTVLGFEQSWATPLVGVGTAAAVQFLLEWVDAKSKRREPRYAGGLGNFINLLVPAIIPGFAAGMLLYANERLWPIAFAAALLVGSKVLFRAPIGGGRTQHFLNPSNFGIAITLLLFPEVGFAPPYHFTANLTGAWHWLLPVLLLLTGVVINALFIGRFPLIAAWLVGFVLQGQFRAWLYDLPPLVPLMPMTSAAFILFTLYMIPDPATSPLKPWRQVAFGLACAVVYGAMQMTHLVFGLFFSLVIVCAIRGISLHIHNAFKTPMRAQGETSGVPVAPAVPTPAN